MKFCKQWKKSVEVLPPYLKTNCISYKKWKKISKTIDSNTSKHHIAMVLANLIKETQNVDKIFKLSKENKVFYTSYSSWLYDGIVSIIPCLGNEDKQNDKIINYAYDYAMLNAECLRKICKRLDKLIKAGVFCTWLNGCKEKHTYAFLGGHDTTVLMYKYKKSNINIDECPICMEDINIKSVLFCGHIICLDCLKRMLNYPLPTNRDKTENTFNIETLKRIQKKNAEKIVCPVCRCPDSFFHITLLKK